MNSGWRGLGGLAGKAESRLLKTGFVEFPVVVADASREMYQTRNRIIVATDKADLWFNFQVSDGSLLNIERMTGKPHLDWKK